MVLGYYRKRGHARVFMTRKYGFGHRSVTRGVRKCPNVCDVIYEWSLLVMVILILKSRKKFIGSF